MTERPERLAGVDGTDLSGVDALVTGSTSGIGREAALALGRLGADTVVVHGRDEAAGEKLVAEFAADAPTTEARFVRADFADVGSVRELAATVRAETDRLGLLLNNAGGLFRESRRTDLGAEYTFHVNHLSPYLLTTELLDHLTEGARVVTTASAAHSGTSLDIERATASDPDAGGWAYSHSKLANVLFAAELSRRLDAAGRPVTSNSVHPGAIPGSGFTRFLPGPLPRLVQLLEAVPGVTSVADGAAELLYVAAADRTADVTGRYFAGQQPTQPSDPARNTENARRLWAESARLLDIEEPLAEYAKPETA